MYTAYPDIILPGNPDLNDDIPQFPRAAYTVNYPWHHLEQAIADWTHDFNLDLSPDYQRDHVWTPEQQTAFIEYPLRGGELGNTLIFVADQWQIGHPRRLELADGKQRLEAVRGFLDNKVPAFGRYLKDFKGVLRFTHHQFQFAVVELKTRADVLKLYLGLNAGGTPHSQAELDRVRAMLIKEGA